MEPYGDVVEDAQKNSPKLYRQVRGFKRETAPASIKVDDVENDDWPINFKPQYKNQSWRTALNKWKSPATPMIDNVKANPKKGIMLVTFGNNGAQYTYDHVPRAVIAQLKYAADSGQSLGKEFWELVRYKGVNGSTGSKYPYWQARAGEGQVTEIPESYKSWLDQLVDKELKTYKEGSDAYKALTADELELVDSLNAANDAEDYTQMSKLYSKGKKNGLFE
jgi:hypothetical protein